MATDTKQTVTVQAIVKAPLDKVWELWTRPEHITNWNFASDDWESPYAENDPRVGGKFKYAMSAKDKSASFDFMGTYTKLATHHRIEYDIEDGRHVSITFDLLPEGVKIIETFEAENVYPPDMQRAGWQSILNNFKKYAESL